MTTLTSSTFSLPCSVAPAAAIIRECAGVSLATIAHLVDTRSRREARAVRSNWMDFLFRHPRLAAQQENWVQAWALFWDTSHSE